MAILNDETKRVLVQGITGREGQARTRLMRDYGTNVVAGVTPGKGGQTVLGVPVFNTPQDAVQALGNIDISVLFVPAAVGVVMFWPHLKAHAVAVAAALGVSVKSVASG